MTIDSYTIKPEDIEEAKQEVLRLEESWRQYGFAKVDKASLEAEGSALTELAKRMSDQEGNLLRLRRQVRRHQSQIRHLTAWLHFWQMLQSRYMPVTVWLSGLTITALFGGCAGVVVRPALAALVGLIGICITTLVFILLNYGGIDPPRRIDNINKSMGNAKTSLSSLEAELQRAAESAKQSFHLWQTNQTRYEHLCKLYDLVYCYEKASQRYHALMEVIRSRRYQLLHSDWRAMRSIIFESFLQEVFEMLGYAVQTTKASGDQGIDLILTGKGRRIGVQAKGYADSVGNHSVMEAHAGKHFYHCDSCIVITNSDFTRTARELAREIGCMIIAGSDIPNLINGNICL